MSNVVPSITDKATREVISELRATGALADGKLTASEAVRYFFSEQAYQGDSGAYAAEARAAIRLMAVSENSLPMRDTMVNGCMERIRGSLAAAGVRLEGNQTEWKAVFFQTAPQRGFINTSVTAR